MPDCVREVAGDESSAPEERSGPALAPVRELRPGRQRILAEARRLFSAEGYERTPLRAISDAVGVTKAALYYHFKAKDDLLVAIVTPMLDRLDGLLDPLGPGLASAEERREFLARYVVELSGHPEVAALLLRDPSLEQHPVGRRFAVQRHRMRAVLGAGDSLVAGIRTTTALRALELAVVEFGEADVVQVRETALNIAIAVLDCGPPAP